MWIRGAAPAAAALVFAVLMGGPAKAQNPVARLAGSKNCPPNVNCIPGLKRVYQMDPTSVFTPLVVADAAMSTTSTASTCPP